MAKSFTEIMEDALSTVNSKLFGSEPNRNGDFYAFPNQKKYDLKIDKKLDKEIFLKDNFSKEIFQKEYLGVWEGSKEIKPKRHQPEKSKRDDSLDALSMGLGAIKKPEGSALAGASVQDLMRELNSRGVDFPAANPNPRIVTIGDAHISRVPRVDTPGIADALPTISSGLGIPIGDLVNSPISNISRQLDALRTAMIESSAIPPMFITDSAGAMKITDTPNNKDVQIKVIKSRGPSPDLERIQAEKEKSDEFVKWCKECEEEPWPTESGKDPLAEERRAIKAVAKTALDLVAEGMKKH